MREPTVWHSECYSTLCGDVWKGNPKMRGYMYTYG